LLISETIEKHFWTVYVAQSIDRIGYVMNDTGFHSQQAKDFSLFSRSALVPTKVASREYTLGSSCFSAGSKREP